MNAALLLAASYGGAFTGVRGFAGKSGPAPVLEESSTTPLLPQKIICHFDVNQDIILLFNNDVNGSR